MAGACGVCVSTPPAQRISTSDSASSFFLPARLSMSQARNTTTTKVLTPDSHFSFDSANHRVASDAFIYAGWKALKALRRSTPNG